MLSRRHLRIKVLQALYALDAARQADYELALDFITDAFKPDLNSMTPQDPVRLEGMRKLSSLLLEENYRKGEIPHDDTLPTEAIVTAKNALKYFQDLYKKDHQRAAKQITPEVEAIYGSYLLMLQIFVELSDFSKTERERQYDDPDMPFPRVSGFDTNTVVKALRESTDLQNEWIRRGVSWSNETNNLVRKLFRETFRTDETYRAYASRKNHSAAEDLDLVMYALKEVILKHDEIIAFFELKDLYWSENGTLARKMAYKTLKSAIEPSGVVLSPLTDDWEEDRFFMEELFAQTVARNDELEQIVAEPLKNWDPSRLAAMDYLLIKMGVAEMMSFPAIPVKVTINEALELAKEYSTPKSAKFVNGILDSLSRSLTQSGKIRKSGRGLLDNK
ncbi:MAG: transcription antitermination factor NusB [Spirosomaceae bacterium]|jgi:N utilization substance protein B|nr:transcription antitermination factor NusB [Spirosomataceae bacterium]